MSTCMICGGAAPHVPCEECGATVHIGQWPLCHGDPKEHHGQVGVFEEPMESYTDVMMDSNPIEITTRRQKIRAMDRRALEPRKMEPPVGARKYFDMGRGG